MIIASARLVGLTCIAALVHFIGVTSTSTTWDDVCTDEEFQGQVEIAWLCPDVFIVSTLAYNPNYPNVKSNITLIFRPSRNLNSTQETPQYVSLYLPGFKPDGDLYSEDATKRALTVTGKNAPVIGLDETASYNTEANGVFDSVALWDLPTGMLDLQVQANKAIVLNKDTEIQICCLILPSSSEADSTQFKIRAPKGLPTGVQTEEIAQQAIQSSPYIDPGLQWEFLQVTFTPAVSMEYTVVSLTVRPGNDLTDQCRIILHMPTMTRLGGTSTSVQFNTAGANDWMIFAHEAIWDATEEKLTFFLRESMVLQKGQSVTLQTYAGEFKLPVEMAPNWDQLTVEARSNDNVDELIRVTAVMQSSNVPHVLYFTDSQLTYSVSEPNATTNVQLSLRTNRPVYAGTILYLRFAGFQAEVVEVPLKGESRNNFQDQIARFSLTNNILELNVSSTMYADEQIMKVEFENLILPTALYENDEGLLIWSSEVGAERQPIAVSPQVAGGAKSFVRSQVMFDPEEANAAANITFSLMPTIIFFQGDQIVISLYGFSCSSTEIPLTGSGAERIVDSLAIWDPELFTLTLTVADNHIVGNTEVFVVSTAPDSGGVYPCTLPDKLTKNDGVLRVEGRGAVINQMAMRKAPSIGSPKFIIYSSINFQAVDGTSCTSSGFESFNYVTKVRFVIRLNADVLPNTTIYIKLGGLLHESQTTRVAQDIKLSGSNAPLFVGGVGHWDPDQLMLSVQVIPTAWIYAGERVRFFLEQDQCFRQPYAAYANDPSFRLAIPEAGVVSTPFNFSDRISTAAKAFDFSQIYYGSSPSDVAYPNNVAEVNLKFRPNVKLPGGSIIRVHLPGFALSASQVTLISPEVSVSGEQDLSLNIPSAQWDQANYNMDITLPLGYEIDSNDLAVARINRTGGFRLPVYSLAINDESLTLACINNQIIYAEPIKESPLVVERTFLVSQFEYQPPLRGSVFHFRIKLVPSVNMTEATPITMNLPGFTNTLARLNIHIKGEDRAMIESSMGQWNETSHSLTLKVTPGEVIQAFQELNFEIEESQGFILPSALNENDTSLTIYSRNTSCIPPPTVCYSILEEPVKVSPMVGNGPFTNHRFCMYQFESGVRTNQPVCTAAEDCVPPLQDPCSAAELLRCGCDPKADSPQPLTMQGFNLQVDDAVAFVPEDQDCGTGLTSMGALTPFSKATSRMVSAEQDQVEYYGITSIQTGVFRVCLELIQQQEHVGSVFSAGFVTVRPACTSPLVMVDGTCVEHCPKTKVPKTGECQTDPIALAAEDTQAVMLSVKMDYDIGTGESITERDDEDPEVRYFIYRYTYEMARLLNADPRRIKVLSLSQGSVIVNTVFTTVGDEEAIAATTERSPRGLASLFRHLQEDTSSSLYQSSFFVNIDRTYVDEPIAVRICPDGRYRVFCPYIGDVTSLSAALCFFLGGTVLVPIILGCICLCAWRIDFDSPNFVTEDILEKVKKDPKTVDASLQAEYARSWLEGRFMGEDWARARTAKLLPIGN